MQIRPMSKMVTFAAIAAAATAALAACSGGGSTSPQGNGPSAGNSTAQVATAANVIKNVSRQAERATSATVVLTTQITGKLPSSMHGTMKIRTHPAVAMEVDITSMSAAGQKVPGGLHEILTSSGIYLKLKSLATVSGKPWIGITTAQLNSTTGNAFAGLTTELRQQDPLSAARMLGASKDVKAVGTTTIDGVPTTHYHGTYAFSSAYVMLTPALQKLMRKYANAFGVGAITFDVWVDAQNNIRKLIESYDSTVAGHVLITMRFTSINKPVSIKAPPASEVGAMPGMG
jgi:hypothetical protein